MHHQRKKLSILSLKLSKNLILGMMLLPVFGFMMFSMKMADWVI